MLLQKVALINPADATILEQPVAEDTSGANVEKSKAAAQMDSELQ